MFVNDDTHAGTTVDTPVDDAGGDTTVLETNLLEESNPDPDPAEPAVELTDEQKAEKEVADKAEADKTAAEEKVVPETYAEFTVPDGVLLDAELLAEFGADFKERGLSQEEAQAEVERGVKLADAWTLKAVAAFDAEVKGWAEDTKKDPTIGGDRLPQVLAGSNEVLNTFGSQEFRGLVNKFGMGNHPEFIKFLHNIRSKVSDDIFVKGGKPAAEPRDAPSVMFPNMKKKD